MNLTGKIAFKENLDQALTFNCGQSQFPLLTTHYSLLTTHYSLLTTHYSLLTTHYSPPKRSGEKPAAAKKGVDIENQFG